MAVDVSAGARLTVGNRRALFSVLPYVTDPLHVPYDIAPDDRRFLFIKSPAQPALNVVLHWFDEIAPRLQHGR